MNVKRLLVEALTVFSASLVASVIVTLLWSLVFHKSQAIDWETSCRFAIVLGIIVPWIGARRGTGR
jgi:hypothetical protein